MNGKEIVCRTLDFDAPERVGRSFGTSDLAGVRYTVKTAATGWAEVGAGRWERTDEWGNIWARLDATSQGEVVKGALQDMDDLAGYAFPDFSNDTDYAQAKQFCAQNTHLWTMGELPGFTFNIARKLYKLENYLCSILLESDRIHRLHDRIDGMLADMIRCYAWAGADSIFFCEDWGTQTRTMISPALWHTEFFPRFKKLCGLAHDCGMRVFMHSCGAIGAIIPGLMEAGIDLFQFDQPRLHGIDNLAVYQKKSKITFWCPVDIQKTLQTKNETMIRAEADELLDALWKGRGGFIAGYYGDNASIGLDPMLQQYACDEFDKQGRRERYLPGR